MSQLESMSTIEQKSSENSPETPFHDSLADSALPASHEDMSQSLSSEEENVLDEELVVETASEHLADESATHESEVEAVKHQPHNQHFQEFLQKLEKQPDNESKLQFAIDFMEGSLAQSGTPHFKSFWETRTICLQLFKENIAPAVRANLWTKYNELSKEARRLKEILDEQSAFAVEQIEIAVKALEDDIAAFEAQLERISLHDFELPSQALASRLPHYQGLQRQLNLLNTHASRINALRKELIRTEMRVRQKNKFFQRLSAAGDKVFPQRKELIKDVSDSFIADVDAFIKRYFVDSDYQNSLFSLREEIKALQNMAKVLTLNTHSFTHTRMRLSECWDKIKSEEKERKKERAQLKVVSKQNFDESMQKIQAFNEAYSATPPSTAEGMKQLDEISAFIRGLEMGRDDRQVLREAWNTARKPLLDKLQLEEQSRQQQDQERENQRRQKITDIRNAVAALIKTAESLDLEALSQQRDELLEQASKANMSKAEKQEIERQLKPLRDVISEKRESSLLTLSDDDRQSLQQLREVLRQRKERRQEIKDQIDQLRKSSGFSGFDFEQAMNQNAQLESEKERLEKINQGIKELELKIRELTA